MSVFGWAQMDATSRTAVKSEWCDQLSSYGLDEIRDACRVHAGASAGKTPVLNAEIIKPIIIAMHKKQMDALGGNTRGPVDIPPDETPADVKARRLMDDPDALKRIDGLVKAEYQTIAPADVFGTDRIKA